MTGDRFCCCCAVRGLPAWPGCDDAFADEGEDCEGCAILEWSLCVLAGGGNESPHDWSFSTALRGLGSTVRLLLRVPNLV